MRQLHMTRNAPRMAGMVIVTALLLSGFGCPHGTKNLAVASSAIATALTNAQVAARQGVISGVISQADETQFEGYLANVARAGLTLDQGIRANESATDLSGQVNSFLDAFSALNNQGLTGIKDPNLRIALTTIITGAESSIAIIAAETGKGK